MSDPAAYHKHSTRQALRNYKLPNPIAKSVVSDVELVSKLTAGQSVLWRRGELLQRGRFVRLARLICKCTARGHNLVRKSRADGRAWAQATVSGLRRATTKLRFGLVDKTTRLVLRVTQGESIVTDEELAVLEHIAVEVTARDKSEKLAR
ncbi:hypothetical protein BC830DRAFT_1133990 [Chytriomyces sp. MP71]|nr:hypothetical protein BC830DRAFT_1133990 [Chytriomyces sp. MP71]